MTGGYLMIMYFALGLASILAYAYFLKVKKEENSRVKIPVRINNKKQNSRK